MPPFTPTLMSMEFTGFFRYKAIIKQRARRNKANHALMKAQKMTLKKELIKTFRNMEGSTPASEKLRRSHAALKAERFHLLSTLSSVRRENRDLQSRLDAVTATAQAAHDTSLEFTKLDERVSDIATQINELAEELLDQWEQKKVALREKLRLAELAAKLAMKEVDELRGIVSEI